MDKKSRNTIIISIVALAIVLITVTYAYFSARITGIESASTISLTAGRMEIVYTEGNEVLSFNNIYPKEEAWVTKTFTLTGYNTTLTDMTYDLGIDITSNTFPDNYLTYDLTLISSTNGTPIATKSGYPLNGIGNKRIGTGTFTNASGDTHNYELKIYFKDNGLDQNDAQDAIFNAKLYVSEVLDAPDGWRSAPAGSLLAAIKLRHSVAQVPLTTPGEQNSLYTIDDAINTSNSTVNSTQQGYYWTYADSIEATENNKFKLVNPQACKYSDCYNNLVGKYLFSSSGGTGAKSTNEVITDEQSKVIKVVSATSSRFTYKEANSIDVTEKVLAASPDDYGTSYYYRGLADDNYVVFAGMCWRIVRVTGDGSIKLILKNYNPNDVTNPCANEYDSLDLALAHYDNTANGQKGVSYFNYSASYNPCDAGFMYGVCESLTGGTATYEEIYENKEKSTVLINLEKWYVNNLSSYDNQIADVIWCNDKSIPNGALIRNANFGASVRSISPSFICPDATTQNEAYKNLSRYTVNENKYGGNGALTYKIGLLTADEIRFAGDKDSTDISYIEQYSASNNGVTNWMTLSPAYLDNYASPLSFRFGKTLNTFMSSSHSYTEGLRPSIALKSSVTISGGNGTASNPYVVN